MLVTDVAYRAATGAPSALPHLGGQARAADLESETLRRPPLDSYLDHNTMYLAVIQAYPPGRGKSFSEDWL